MDALQDKIAFITGSDSGIGQATAIEFAREGANVVVHYLHDEQGANSTREQVEAHGRRAIVVHGDHGFEDQVEAMFQTAFDAFDRVDILMNDASVDASGTYVAAAPSTSGTGAPSSRSTSITADGKSRRLSDNTTAPAGASCSAARSVNAVLPTSGSP